MPAVIVCSGDEFSATPWVDYDELGYVAFRDTPEAVIVDKEPGSQGEELASRRWIGQSVEGEFARGEEVRQAVPIGFRWRRVPHGKHCDFFDRR